MKDVQIKTILDSRNGMKYYSGPDLISYLHEMKEGQSKEVQAFISDSARKPICFSGWDEWQKVEYNYSLFHSGIYV